LGSSKKADLKAAKTQIGMLKGALDHYALDVKSFPSTEQGLEALVERPTDLDEGMTWEGPYLDGKKLPKDPWGNDYLYECVTAEGQAEEPRLWSMGPDKQENTEDDVCSWDRQEGGGPEAGATGESSTTKSGSAPPVRSKSGPAKGAAKSPAKSTTSGAPRPDTNPVRSSRKASEE
jgi:general secretion pathway protein G